MIGPTRKSCSVLLFVFLCLANLTLNAHAQTKNSAETRSELVLVALSPEGSQLAVARSSYDIVARNGRVELWDLKSGELRQTLTGFDGSISYMTFLPDGKSLLTTSSELRQSKIQEKPRDRSGNVVTELKWWDSRSGEFLRKITLEESEAIETVLSPDGNTIAVVQHYIHSGNTAFYAEALGSPFDPLRRFAAKRSVFENFEVKLIDARNGKRMMKVSADADSFVNPWAVQFVPSAFSPDGKYIAVASAREVKIWDVLTGEKVQTLRKFDGCPIVMTFSPDSRSLALSSGDVSSIDNRTITQSEISVWEVATAKLIRNLHGKSDYVTSLSYTANGKALLFGTLQYEPDRTFGTVKVWDFDTNRLATFNVHDGQQISSLALRPGKSELVLQSGDVVELRDTRTWRVKQSFEADRAESRGTNRFVLSVKRVVAISFSADGINVSGVIPEDALRTWDSRTGAGKNLQEIKTGNGLIARSGDGKVVGEATSKEIKLWDLSNETSHAVPHASSNSASAFALSFDGQLLAIAEPRQINLSNSTDGRSLRSLTGHESLVEHLAFSDDGHFLVSADESGMIKIWDVLSGRLKQSISTGSLVTALAIDPAGELVASAGSDFLISIWNVSTGALQLRLKKHENVVNALTFSPDRRTLASGGDDRVVVLWDVFAGRSKQTLKGHDLTVTSLAFSPDNNLLASGSGNASVVLWNVNSGKLDRVLR